MGRNKKDTADYFPHDSRHGKTIRILQNKYGNVGYAVWFKTLELLAHTGGHAYSFKEAYDYEDMLAYLLIDEETFNNIFDTLLVLKAIDRPLFEEKIIWSDNFLEGIKPLYDRRKDDLPTKPPTKKAFMSTENDKGKERKGKKSKEKDYLPPMGEFENVLLTKDEYDKLADKVDNRDSLIDRLSVYMESSGTKYKSHYATLLNWHKRDEKDKPKDNPRGFIG
jgi:hypothetical protein